MFFQTENTSFKTLLFGIVTALFVCSTIALAIALGITLKNSKDHNEVLPVTVKPTTNSTLCEADGNMQLLLTNYAFRMPSSKLGIYRKASVSSDAKKCATVGKNILLINGTAVDAALATLFCNGVVHSHSMGIGGGFLMTVYIRSEGRAYSLNAREVAPGSARAEDYIEDRSPLAIGPKSIAVPGELMGYLEAKQRFGNPKISWFDIMAPTIEMCEQGLSVTRSLAHAIKSKEEKIREDPAMKETFLDPETGKILVEGQTYVRPKLAKTLRELGEKGLQIFYNGSLAQTIVGELQSMGGMITLEDLKNYTVQWESPVTVHLSGGLTLFTSPPPGSGSILGAILKVMDLYNLNENSRQDPLTFHRFVEACKFAYAQRSKIGDWTNSELRESIQQLVKDLSSDEWALKVRDSISDDTTSSNTSFYQVLEKVRFIEDSGTTHISVLAENGDAVSVTSTVNEVFGSVIMSPSTGIIFNNQMDDFSVPNTSDGYGIAASSSNHVSPGKRPVSSMSPTVVVDKSKNVKMVIGASGGPRIISGTSYVAMRHLWIGENIKDSIDVPRLHHQLLPMQVTAEYGVPEAIIKKLEDAGHNVTYSDTFFGSGYSGSRVQAIAVDSDGIITANNDRRKDGQVDGF